MCDLAPLYGRCSDNSTKWHYDPYTQECQEFVYSGCYGNKNNFDDKRSCENACKRGDDDRGEEPPTDPRPVDPVGPRFVIFLRNSQRMFECNKKTFFRTTPTFVTCPTRAENATITLFISLTIKTKEDVVNSITVDVAETAIDLLQNLNVKLRVSTVNQRRRVKVNCERKFQARKGFTHYFLQSSSSTHNDMESVVRSSTLINSKLFSACVEVCLMPAEVGSCENETNYIRRYYFDDTRGTCLSFIYSGCNGNENNFQTYDSCLEKCQDSKLQSCILSMR